MIPALAIVAAIILSAAADAQPPAADVPLRVIVHPANGVSSLSRAEVSAIFMRRVRRWPDGSEIVPVDQSVRSRARDRFSRAIHGKSVAYVTRYWQRLIFSGRGIPPHEEAGDAAVIEFVSSHPASIGYVESTNPTGGRIRIVEVTP